MADNKAFENKVIAGKAQDILLTNLDARTLMTIDTTLAENEGMTKTINTYTYSGKVEEVAEGQGNTVRGSVTFVGKDYKVKMAQQAFDYKDEDEMKDKNIVDFGTKGAMDLMTNYLTGKFFEALKSELIGKTEFKKGAAISYDTVVDAISDLNIEDESKLVLLIPNAWKGAIRKDPDYKAAQMGQVIYNGQVGTVAGLPVVATKALTKEAYILTPEAVTLFLKKDMEVEDDRDKDKRINSYYFREAFICALTDATKVRKIVEAQA